MITLNQIKYKLIDFFNSHAQINTVSYGDDFDFAAERSNVYPVVNFEYLSTSLNNKALIHSYKVIIGDLVNSNTKVSQDEIISDSIQVADDFFTWLYTVFDFEFTKSSSIQSFTDDNADRTAGIVFTVNLSVIRPQNDCQTPYK